MLLNKIPQQSEQLSRLEREFKELDQQYNAAEDRVFASFCKLLKLKSIREYEANQGIQSSEAQSARLAFESQKKRLQNQ